MSDNTSKASPNGGAFASGFDRLLSALNGIGTLWILVLLILLNADVAGRNLFFAPIDGVFEIVEITIVAIVFLQLGDATRLGRLTRSDGFFGLILKRRPRIGHIMGAVFDLLGALFMFFILYGSWPNFVEAWEGNYFAGNEGVFTAPTWPVKLIIVIGCVVTLILFIGFAWRHVRAFSNLRAGGEQVQ